MPIDVDRAGARRAALLGGAEPRYDGRLRGRGGVGALVFVA